VDGDQKQSDDTELLRAWHEYGKNFSAFVPEEQPFPEIWEPEIPEPDDKGARQSASPKALAASIPH